MNPQEERELLRQIAQLRRETRSLRRWVMFSGICVGIILFTPQLAAFIAICTARLFDLSWHKGLAPIVALLVVFVVGAIFASRLYSPDPQHKGSDGDNA